MEVLRSCHSGDRLSRANMDIMHHEKTREKSRVTPGFFLPWISRRMKLPSFGDGEGCRRSKFGGKDQEFSPSHIKVQVFIR